MTNRPNTGVSFCETTPEDWFELRGDSSVNPEGKYVAWFDTKPLSVCDSEEEAKQELQNLLTTLTELDYDMTETFQHTFNYVHKMHTTFGHPAREYPEQLPKTEHELAIRLIKEELQELEEAYAKNDLKEIIDALGDLDVVVNGYMVRSGVYGPALAELVYASNMSKVCHTEEEAVQGCAKYTMQGIQTYYKENHEGVYIIYRSSDDKFLKGPKFFTPKITEYFSLTEIE